MKKERIIWLSKDSDYRREYTLWERKPLYNQAEGAFRGGDCIRTFCEDEFKKLCPALKLRKDAIQKIKLTQLKNGIKLEKVGKPIKG